MHWHFALFRPSKNLFFDGYELRAEALSKNVLGKVNSPSTLKFQSFRSANTGDPRPLREKAFLGKGRELRAL